MGLFWLFVLAEIFVLSMMGTSANWRGLNQKIPAIMATVATICWAALAVLIVIVFIKVRPWWYGLVMLAIQLMVPLLMPFGKIGGAIVAAIGTVAGPIFVVLSFLKVFAVI